MHSAEAIADTMATLAQAVRTDLAGRSGPGRREEDRGHGDDLVGGLFG
jgi:hypothetical protein